MNRQLKFRVWDKQNKNWDAELNEGTYGWDTEGITLNQFIEYITCARQDPYPNQEKRFIIQQFTGLKDKDGKEIYEGDIVENDLITSKSIQIVQWDDGHGCFKLSCDSHLEMLTNTNITLKIIGNIFETPDLIKN
jgi:uncharacterized phage protein (TIGR01671 family)